MNKSLAVVVAAFVSSVGWSQSTLAQESVTKASPVEFFACSYQAGKGAKDLDKVVEKFQKWTDKHDPGYSAWTLTPQFHSGVDFDVGWLGGWANGDAFGKGQDTWMTKGGEMASAFNDVMDCSARHELVSSVAINAPKAPPGDGVVMFAECTLQEGKTLADSFAAHKKAGAAMQAMGSKASSWLFYPGIGAGDIDFHYWQVIAFKNYTELGAASEIYTNGGGWQKTMELTGAVTRCGSPSLFDVRQVHAGTPS